MKNRQKKKVDADKHCLGYWIMWSEYNIIKWLIAKDDLKDKKKTALNGNLFEPSIINMKYIKKWINMFKLN
jgi:hypothetical protein